MRKVLFQGTFDPITKGHINIIKRALKLFDEVVVLVAININKTTLFTKEERLQIIKECVKNLPHVKVDSYDGLTVDYMRKNKIDFSIRGLRNILDFEYEKNIEIANKNLYDKIETIYLTSDTDKDFVSATTVRELISYNQDISKYVEKPVINMVKKIKKEGR